MEVVDVVNDYPCPRTCKLALASGRTRSISRRPPLAFPHVYDDPKYRNDADASWFTDRIRESKADVVVWHFEMYSGWLAEAVREGAGDRPLVLNIHDVTAARGGLVPDQYEPFAYECADAFVFVMEAQRDFAAKVGYDVRKPTHFIPNFPSSSMFVDKPLLPYEGGIVYEGGADKRGQEGGWRDLSDVADMVPLHMYAANDGIEYGIKHESLNDYRILIHHLSTHDWGLTGTMRPEESWKQTFPNKVGDYWAAGIPFVALNTPIMQYWADRGMGICLEDARELRRLPDPRPYKKAVMEQRREYTIEAYIEKYEEFLKELA